jgi:hypothetical protein
MSDVLPLFASAPRMVIYVNNKPIAYAIGLSVASSWAVETVQVLGEFIAQSIEPLYMPPVSGTFSIIELLTPQAQSNMKTAANQKGTIANPAGSYTDLQKKGTVFSPGLDNTTGTGNSALNASGLFRHLDPASVLISQTFDIAIYMKVPVATMGSDGQVNFTDAKNRFTQEEFMFIKECRLTSKSVNISPGSLVNVPLEFQGLLIQNAALSENAREQLDSSNYQS